MSNGNGHGSIPPGVLEVPFQPVAEPYRPPRRRRPFWPVAFLFFCTVLTTLLVGSDFARSFARGDQPFTAYEHWYSPILLPVQHPSILLLGIPYSFTLLAILLAHEMGHFFACKIYGIDASYPYFLPAPTLVGTFGAFIRIRSPITTRRALFDIGIAGPIAGFVLTVPAMAWGVAASKIIPGTEDQAIIIFGVPRLMQMFNSLFHPGADPSWLLLHPVGRAAWVGCLVTALNLLPAWQLDGGHIMYALNSRYHFPISVAVALTLIAGGTIAPLWYFWGAVLLVLSWRYRHPPLLNRWEPLDSQRKLWAIAALAIFLLCFMPQPATSPKQPEPVHARLVGSTSAMIAVPGISLAAQKSRHPLKTCASAERCGDFKTN
jgi:Zn-dependent protease